MVTLRLFLISLLTAVLPACWGSPAGSSSGTNVCSGEDPACRNRRVSTPPQSGVNCDGQTDASATTQFIHFQDTGTGCFGGGEIYNHDTALAAKNCADRDATACRHCAKTATNDDMHAYSCRYLSGTADSESIDSTSTQDAETCFRSHHPRDTYVSVSCS